MAILLLCRHCDAVLSIAGVHDSRELDLRAAAENWLSHGRWWICPEHSAYYPDSVSAIHADLVDLGRSSLESAVRERPGSAKF